MAHATFAHEILARLRVQHPRFRDQAYLFVLSALHDVVGGLPHPRHISGRELCLGVRALAIRDFGPLARSVLSHWGVESTADVGEIVFALVDAGVLVKEEGDSLRDFQDLFDFQQAFEQDYPWGRDGLAVGGW
jgi:uncharacterized repeat protein (TIGR04138 family)